MREYLKFMEDSIAAVDANLSGMKCYARPYLTLPFYLTCERLLDEAEALCAADAKALLHVRRERVPVDAGLCHMWDDLTRNLPAEQKLPWERKFLLDRYESYRLEQLEACRTAASLPQAKSELSEEMARLRAAELPLPEQLGKLGAGQFPGLHVAEFSRFRAAHCAWWPTRTPRAARRCSTPAKAPRITSGRSALASTTARDESSALR